MEQWSVEAIPIRLGRPPLLFLCSECFPHNKGMYAWNCSNGSIRYTHAACDRNVSLISIAKHSMEVLFRSTFEILMRYVHYRQVSWMAVTLDYYVQIADSLKDGV